tara:strand:- start:7020 stop:8060 length:1041 start_codon:yes stop_codon:yes gene_type:complete
MECLEFGKMENGDIVNQYTLKNDSGMALGVLTYGGIIRELWVPDREGEMADIVLGFNTLEDYIERNDPYFGCITGRVAGRTTGGKFTLEGVDYKFVLNDEPNHLHGGLEGLNRRVWKAKELSENSIQLSYTSLDGDQGYPGNLEMSVIYTLTEENELRLEYHAKTDQATPICLTNHSYFNLAGEDSGPVDEQTIQIFSDQYVPTDEFLTLLGGVESVEGKANDLRVPKTFGETIPNLHLEHGDNYMLKKAPSNELIPVARTKDLKSGRVMDTLSTDNCLQFYTGHFLDKDGLVVVGKSGDPYKAHAGYCLECQGYPDGVNSPEIMDNILRPGERFQETTLYRFTTE